MVGFIVAKSYNGVNAKSLSRFPGQAFCFDGQFLPRHIQQIPNHVVLHVGSQDFRVGVG